jgi:succinyl-CoA synthetase beta subunit
MKVHEYQAKSLLARYGVAIPKGEVASTPEEAREIAKRLSGGAVVKAQIHAGGGAKAAASASRRTPNRRSSTPGRSSA